MCNPMILGVATLAIGAASAVGQMQAQNAAYAAQQQSNALQIQNAQASHALTESAIQETLVEHERVDNTEKNEKAIETRQAKSRAAVASAEAGVSGLSVDALQRDYSASLARYRAAIDLTAQNRRQQARRDLTANNEQFRQRATTVDPGAPSMLTPLLNFGTAAIGAYSTYKDASALNPPTTSTPKTK